MTSEADLKTIFPGLIDDDFEITSPDTDRYNCIAWAAHDDSSWWWPLPFAGPPLGGYYWPDGLPLVERLDIFVRAFRMLGYRECDDGELEDGFEKVAIYVDSDEEPTHAARQLPDGRWTSKLGKLNDIAHGSAEAVGGDEGGGYGAVAQFMRRRIIADRPPPGAMDLLGTSRS